MKNNGSKSSPPTTLLPTYPTGIQSLDDITGKRPHPVRTLTGNRSDPTRALFSLGLRPTI